MLWRSWILLYSSKECSCFYFSRQLAWLYSNWKPCLTCSGQKLKFHFSSVTLVGLVEFYTKDAWFNGQSEMRAEFAHGIWGSLSRILPVLSVVASVQKDSQFSVNLKYFQISSSPECLVETNQISVEANPHSKSLMVPAD